MIKKILLAAVVALGFGSVASAQTLKIGLVDAAAIITAMPDYTKAQQELQELNKKYEADINAMTEELQTLYEKLANMTEDELPARKERMARDFQDKQQRLQQFQESAMTDMQNKQQEKLGPLQTQVRNAIESVGRENGYSLIQDQNPQITFFHQSPVDDITPLVKAKLNLK